MTRLIFDNETVSSEKAIGSLILKNSDDDSVYELFSRGSEDNRAAFKLSQRFLKCNDGGPPLPKRQNVVAVGEKTAVLFCLNADLRLKNKPRVDGDECKEDSGSVVDEIVYK